MERELSKFTVEDKTPIGIVESAIHLAGVNHSMEAGVTHNLEVQEKHFTTSEIQLSERTREQLNEFMGMLRRYNEALPPEIQRNTEELDFLDNFYVNFIKDRNDRAEEVQSPEYQQVLDKAGFPMTTLFIQCMDGRVKPIHTNGGSSETCSAVRGPRAFLREFVRGKEGSMTLIPRSNFARMLDVAIARDEYEAQQEDRDPKGVAEVFDSHVGCAARGLEESARGRGPKDAGLYADVLEKRDMVRATRKYLDKKYGEEKHIALIQTSFDPHEGTMMMGLESDAALEVAVQKARTKAQNAGKNPDRAKPEFSQDVISELVEDGKIISTKHLLRNTEIKNVVDTYRFDIDWQNNYIASAEGFWGGINNGVQDGVLEPIKDKLKAIYPHLATDNARLQTELEERAMLIWTNTFNAALHNPALADIENHDPEKNGHSHYKYGKHQEEGVWISEGGRPPYGVTMFVIDSRRGVRLPDDVELASGIVRGNRAEGRVVDRSGKFTQEGQVDGQEFAQAPVPVVVQEYIRDATILDSDWDILRSIDFSDLDSIDLKRGKKPWDQMTNTEFELYLLEKNNKLPKSIRRGVNNLRRKMQMLYDVDQPTSTHLSDLYKVALPIIGKKYGATECIIPFIKLGHDEQLEVEDLEERLAV